LGPHAQIGKRLILPPVLIGKIHTIGPDEIRGVWKVSKVHLEETKLELWGEGVTQRELPGGYTS